MLALVCVTSAPASAQDDDTTSPAKNARFHWGILHLTPFIAVSNLGTDTNVFNDSASPQQDTTLTAGPGADLFVTLGRTLVSGQVSGQYNYYKRFAQQRSVNTTDRLRWDIPLGHLTPFVSGTYSTLRNRTYEIDARIRQETRGLEGGTVVRISGRTSFELSGARTLVNYAADESYRGTPLTTLNESTSTEHVAFRYRLTPLTTFVVDTRAMQDRFFYQPLRDANSIKVMPGFDLKPAALISGGVYVGVRRFRPITAEVPAYQGVAATVDANLINGSRLFKLLVGRDVAYSYLLDEPYYALTDATLTVTQRITRTWDVMVRGGLQTLDYHHVVTDQPFPRHLDRLYQYGGGFGYRVGRTIRIGLNALQVSRSSSVLPNYSGLRVGVSVDYGLIQ